MVQVRLPDFTREGVFGTPRIIESHGVPLRGHISHLRHLARAATAEVILVERHGMTKPAARSSAVTLASHVRQAIAFYEAAQFVSAAVAPVLCYYCYLNLASATIIAHRPPNWAAYRRHGLSDSTASLRRIALSSPVVEVGGRHGALTLLHKLLSGGQLHRGHYTLKTLCASIPWLSAELQVAFGLTVRGHQATIRVHSDSKTSHYVHLLFSRTAGDASACISYRKLEVGVPLLTSAFRRVGGAKLERAYRSIRTFTCVEDARAFTRNNCLPIINLGAQDAEEDGVQPTSLWTDVNGCPLLPALTAAMMLAFCAASVARYRPHLIGVLDGARENILFDAFAAEANEAIIPAYRNLLYREQVAIRTKTTQ